MGLASTDIGASVPSGHEWIKSGIITSTSLALSLGTYFVPTTYCYWCSYNSFDHSIARAWTAADLKAARITSNIIAFGLIPLIVISSLSLTTDNTNYMLQDALVIVSSAASATALTELIKIAVRRKRPEAAFGFAAEDSQSNRSFPSGHTSLSFSMITSASILAFKRGSKLAGLFTSVSSVAATTVGISRIVAAKHWACDVLVGMALGIGVGVAMPFIVLDKNDTQKIARFYLVADPLINGLQLGINW